VLVQGPCRCAAGPPLLLLLQLPLCWSALAAGVFVCSLLASFTCSGLEPLLLPFGCADVSLLCEGAASGAGGSHHQEQTKVRVKVCRKDTLLLPAACTTKEGDLSSSCTNVTFMLLLVCALII
jgi:hypothetical protein